MSQQSNKIEIRVITKEELELLFVENFERVFSNRVVSPSIQQPNETDAQKMRERKNKDTRFRLRLGVFVDGKPAGWHVGFATDAETYYMQNSATLETYRDQGLYSKLLAGCLEKVKAEGFQVVTSLHHPNNPAVLIPKLKAGFIISGTQFHEHFRFLVDLKYFFDVDRKKAFGKNLGLDL